jgi:hypothetical protein
VQRGDEQACERDRRRGCEDAGEPLRAQRLCDERENYDQDAAEDPLADDVGRVEQRAVQ